MKYYFISDTLKYNKDSKFKIIKIFNIALPCCKEENRKYII